MRKVISEKYLEARLRKEIECRGGMAVKLTSQYHRGLPDRLVLMPGSMASFVELKTTGKKPEPLQEVCHRKLREMTFPVFVVSDIESLDTFLTFIDAEQQFREIL